MSDYLKIAQKVVEKKPSKRARRASATPHASSNGQTPPATKATEATKAPDYPSVAEEPSRDQSDKSEKAACKHNVEGGCWLCQREIERLIGQGTSPRWARAEVLGRVEEDLGL